MSEGKAVGRLLEGRWVVGRPKTACGGCGAVLGRLTATMTNQQPPYCLPTLIFSIFPSLYLSLFSFSLMENRRAWKASVALWRPPRPFGSHRQRLY